MRSMPTLLATMLAPLAVAGCCAKPCSPCAAARPAPGPSISLVSAGDPLRPTPRFLVESVFIQVPSEHAAAVLGAQRGQEGMELMSSADASALLARAQKDAKGKVLAMPSIVVESGDEGSLFVGESYDDTPHRPVREGQCYDGHTASLQDPAWSGVDLRVQPVTLPDAADFALDLSFIWREAPPKNAPPPSAARPLEQVHGRMGIARMTKGDSAVIVRSMPAGSGTSSVLLLVTTPTLLPPETASTR